MALTVALGAVGVGGCKDGGETGDETSAASTGGTASSDSSGGEADSGSSSTAESGDTAVEGSSDGEVGDGPWDSLAERPCPDDSFVTFENFGWPHMLTFCNGCHSSMLPADMRQGAPLEINFESIEDVRESADRIWARAGDQHDTMPPVGPAVDEERRLLGEWLACGAPTDVDLEDE